MVLNKKGSVVQIFIVVAFLFLLGVAFLIQHYIMNEFISEVKPALQKTTASPTGNKTIYTAMTKVETTTNMFDSIFIFVLVGLLIAAIITSALVDVHPVFFVFFWLLVGLALVITVPLSNSFGELGDNSILVSTATDHFPMTSLVFQYLPLWILVFAAIVTIVLFAKTRGFFGGGGAAI